MKNSDLTTVNGKKFRGCYQRARGAKKFRRAIRKVELERSPRKIVVNKSSEEGAASRMVRIITYMLDHSSYSDEQVHETNCAAASSVFVH